MYKSFNELFKEIRLQKDITQIQIAKHLKVHKNTVSAWENSVNEPSIDIIRKLALYFDVPTDYLFGITDEYGNQLNYEPSLKFAAREKPKPIIK